MRNKKGQFVLSKNIYESYGGSTRIKLNGGKWAFIDTDKLELIKKYSWALTKTKWTNYASARPRELGYKSISMHRLIMNPKSWEFIDHINHDGIDNRLSNLRICTKAENCRNQIKTVGESMYKGVCPSRNKWQASIRGNGKQIYLGVFSTQEEAASAYNKAAPKYHGEFAKLNLIDRKHLKEGGNDKRKNA